MSKVDVAVIGSGPGGYVCAIRAAQLGMKAALVEKDQALGGTCLNVGCIPSKVLLESSEAYYAARHKFALHGVHVGSVEMDIPAMMARKGAIVKDLTDGIAVLMKKNKVEVLKGAGRLMGPDRVEVTGAEGTTVVEASSVVLAMGSVPIQLPFLPFDGRRVVTSTEALSFGTPPGRLAVIGAGAVGLELGSVWSRLGSEVTVVELLPRIAPFAEAQMSQVLERALKAQGMAFRTGTQVTGADVGGADVRLQLRDAKGIEDTLECDTVLVAVGRRPNSASAGIREVGVALDERGIVKVNAQYRTGFPNVYAIGDLIPGPMLAHKASEEGVAVAEVIAGKPGGVDYGAIPNVVYTHPELAAVGLTEEQAKAEGLPVKVGKFYFKGSGRAKSLGEEEGLVKVVAHAETDRLLGVHIVGARASDMIAEAVVALEFKGSAEDLGRIVHAHPTLSEMVKEAALAVDKAAIHG